MRKGEGRARQGRSGDRRTIMEGSSLKNYLAMDVGGSKYIIGIIGRDGTLVAERRGVWRELTRDCVMETILAEAKALLADAGVRPIACGITIPGLADHRAGVWVEAQFSGIRNVPICAEVEAALGIPAWCDNDGQAFSLAEMVFGACQDVRNFLYVNVSTGIGGSIVADGRLIYGATGCCGEIGHCVVVPGGRPCNCGSRGCLEKYASGPAIALNYAEAGGALDAEGRRADAKLIAERARGGEALAIEIYRREGVMLGGMIAKAVNLLNPEMVVLGGGVALAFDLFGPALIETVRDQTYHTANPDVRIQPTGIGYLAGLYGAAAIAVSREEHLFE